jgi:protein gp37
MGKDTAIAWCSSTFNPWHGCTKVSPGCQNCYAERLGNRYGVEWGADAPRRFFSDAHWREPLAWNRAAEKAGERRRVFCGSMCDVMEPWTGFYGTRLKLGNLIRKTLNLDWLLLTKRPECWDRALLEMGWDTKSAGLPENIWLGVTAENQEMAERRIPILLRTPAAVRFVSAEPLLGPVDFGKRLCQPDWLIVGAESGPNARPMDLAWARSLLDQCQAAGVSFFMKQICERGKPIPYDDFPDDLKIREFPSLER